MRVKTLKENAFLNDIKVERLDASALREREPNVTGRGALLVRASVIGDYPAVARKIVQLIAEKGGVFIQGVGVSRVKDNPHYVEVIAKERCWLARKVVLCSGLHADRLARRSSVETDFKIVSSRVPRLLEYTRRQSFIRNG